MKSIDWKRIDAMRPHPTVAIPASAFTAERYAEKYRINKGSASNELRDLVKHGRLKRGWKEKKYWYWLE